jgi:hypothetical protein
MFVKSLLTVALLASSTATAFNGPTPNAIVSPKQYSKSALHMAGGSVAPALKVCIGIFVTSMHIFYFSGSSYLYLC